MFESKPFQVQREAAIALAQLCCNEDSLPQGSPASPIISNLICRRMDRELSTFARANGCTYTRYADDLTFSTHLPQLPAALATHGNVDTNDSDVSLGSKLVDIINNHSFDINDEKIRLQPRHARQTVTGLVVNDQIGLPLEWWKELRAMLYAINTHGLANASSVWASRYDSRFRSGQSPSIDRVMNGRLLLARMVAGNRSRKYLRYARQWLEVSTELVCDTIRDDVERSVRPVVPNDGTFTYDLAISFASEQQDRVDRFVDHFESAGLAVFYAPRSQANAQMIGEELPDYLERAFGSESKRCIIFASVDYVEKVWTGYERQVIISTFVQRGPGYVWPIMFDDVKIDGLPDSIGYMGPSDGTDEEIASALADRLVKEKWSQ